MELRQLRHFVAVADARHFTRAAARSHVVQSTLSTSISCLERELGAALLVRNNRHVGLTAAGQAFLPEARRAIAAADSARVAVDAVRGVRRGQLTIGVVHGLSFIDLPALLARYHERHPGISVALRHDAVDNLIESTVDGNLDLAVVSPPYDKRQTTERPLGAESLLLVVSRHDPLAQTEVAALQDLQHREFIDLQADFAVRQHVDAICSELGFQRTICCESDTPNALVDLVEAGFGVAILPPALLKGTDRVVGIATEPAIRRELTLVTSATRPLSPATVAFLDELRPRPVIAASSCRTRSTSNVIAVSTLTQQADVQQM